MNKTNSILIVLLFVAGIGIRGMGQNHIKAYQALENVNVAALCDVDENQSAKAKKIILSITDILIRS